MDVINIYHSYIFINKSFTNIFANELFTTINDKVGPNGTT